MLDAFRERKLKIIESLGSLADLAKQIGATSAGTALEAQVIQKLKDDQFHLVVVGEFNHGKTSFVNALLGSRVLPTGVTPTTAAIHHLVYSDAPRASVKWSDGQISELEFDKVSEFSVEGREDGAPLQYLEIGYPAALLEERIVLVDTPGVNDLSLTRAEITYGYIPRADAVLFVLDAGQPVKESERQFLQERLIGQSRDRILYVVAKSDIWSAEEQREALDYIVRRLSEVVKEPKVFPVSNLGALDGDAAESGVPELVRYLSHFLATERGALLLKNAVGEGLRAAELMGKGIDARQRAQTMNLAELEKRIELLQSDLETQGDTIEKRRLMIREEAAAIKAWARRDLDRFCDEMIQKLPSLLEAVSAEDVRQHLGAFLQHSFKQWAEAETREIALSLEQLAERTLALVKDDANDVGRRVSEAMGAQVLPPEIEIDTFASDVGVFAVLSVGVGVVFANALLGGFLIAAAPILALYNRDRTEAEVRKRALELSPVVLREAAGKVAPKIDQMVGEFTERLENWVASAGEDLHKEVIEVLQSVRNERARSQQQVDSERELCDEALQQLDSVKRRLLELGGFVPPEISDGARAEGPRREPAEPDPSQEVS